MIFSKLESGGIAYEQIIKWIWKSITYNIEMDCKGITCLADLSSRGAKAVSAFIWSRGKNLSCICWRRYILRKEGLAYEED